MPLESQSDLIAALAKGELGEIIGTTESEWLDFKGAPYHLAEEWQKVELAKDISALANRRGGVILVAVETAQDATSRREIATKVKRIPCNLVNVQQYRDVAETYCYPPVRDLALKWWCEEQAKTGSTGVLSIEVRAAEDHERPVLVSRLADEGAREGILVGVFERVDDRVGRLTPYELHSQIQDGRAVQRGARFSGVKYLHPAYGEEEAQADERLKEDVADSDLVNHRRYFLQAFAPGTEVERFHERGPDGIPWLLSWPNDVRGSVGWGMGTGAQASVIAGGGLRIMLDAAMSLSLDRGGTLTWVCTCGNRYLGFGFMDGCINPIALVESTLNFVRMYVNQVLPLADPRPRAWFIRGGMADLREGGTQTSLGWGPVNQPTRLRWCPIPSESISFGPWDFSNRSPGSIAFSVVREIFLNAGIDESGIPCALKSEISEKLIRESG